jgi:hypothetical protein
MVGVREAGRPAGVTALRLGNDPGEFSHYIAGGSVPHPAQAGATTPSEVTMAPDTQDCGHAVGGGSPVDPVQQGLTLHAVQEKSRGRWKAVVVDSYERADRAVTAAKLVELAEFYGVPAAALLPPDARPNRSWGRVQRWSSTCAGSRRCPQPGRSARPVRSGDPVSARQLQRQGLTVRREDLRSLAIIYDLRPEI